MVTSSKPKRLRPSIESPSKGLNLSWVPDGMDSSCALRIAVRVPAFVEACDDGRNVSHSASDFLLIRDRDTLNLKDLRDDVSQRLNPGKNRGFHLQFYDTATQRYTIVSTDAVLMIMEKQDIRKTLSGRWTDKILPHITKHLHAMSRNLQYVIHRGPDNTAEIEGTTKELKTWRHTVDLENRTCSCQRWQITGLPCTHALCIINSMRNRSVEDFVDNYYSVAMFKKAYEMVVRPMIDRTQWPKVDMGFKLWPPRFKRAAGRPRNRRIKGAEEGGTKKRQHQCKRCGQLGHMAKTCNETVYDSDAPPPQQKKQRTKKSTKATTISTQQSQIEGISMSVATPTPALTNSPAANTRSKKAIVDAPKAQLVTKKKVTTKRISKKKQQETAGTSNEPEAPTKRISKKKLILDL